MTENLRSALRRYRRHAIGAFIVLFGIQFAAGQFVHKERVVYGIEVSPNTGIAPAALIQMMRARIKTGTIAAAGTTDRAGKNIRVSAPAGSNIVVVSTIAATEADEQAIERLVNETMEKLRKADELQLEALRSKLAEQRAGVQQHQLALTSFAAESTRLTQALSSLETELSNTRRLARSSKDPLLITTALGTEQNFLDALMSYLIEVPEARTKHGYELEKSAAAAKLTEMQVAYYNPSRLLFAAEREVVPALGPGALLVLGILTVGFSFVFLPLFLAWMRRPRNMSA